MANFFDSNASNFLVSIAAKVSKVEKSISRECDSEALLALYNSIQRGVDEIEKEIKNYQEKNLNKEVS